MSLLAGSDPVLYLSIGVCVGAVARLTALVIALRGTSPHERPAIIRALAEFFRLRRDRRR